jgi:hypothetical protein
MMPRLIDRRAFSLDAIRTIQSLKMKNLRNSWEYQRFRRTKTQITARQTINTLVNA